MLEVLYAVTEDNEVIMKFNLKDASALFGKDCIYVSSLTNDAEFMELFKVCMLGYS
jgi:hypothetical protein